MEKYRHQKNHRRMNHVKRIGHRTEAGPPEIDTQGASALKRAYGKNNRSNGQGDKRRLVDRWIMEAPVGELREDE